MQRDWTGQNGRRAALDGMHLHGEEGVPFGHLPSPLIRVTANDGKECWGYQFPMNLWRDAVRRVMPDMRAGKLPDAAAGGLLEMIAEAVSDEQ